MTQPGGPRRAEPEPPASYLRELCDLLWPAPAEVTVGRAPGDGAPAAEYLLIPDAHRPKLAVPVRPARAASAAVTGFNSGRSRRARLLSGVLRAALRTPLAAPVLRDRIRVRGPRDATLPRHLRDLLGTELDVAFQVGPPRANRKPVLQLLAPDGRVLGYAKIGVNPLTDRLVRAEADTLRALARARLRTLTVPGVLHAGRWRGHELLVQQALPVWRAPAPPAPRRVADAMRELSEVTAPDDAPGDAAYWPTLRRRVGELADPQAAALDAALTRLDTCAAPRLRYGCWHGDWTSWNTVQLTDTVLAWDWERFATGVPVGFDALHLHVQDATTRDRVPPGRAVAQTAARAPRLLAPFGVDADTAPLVTALYFAEIATRYLADDQTRAGSWLGSELIPALIAHIAPPHR